MIKTLVFDLGGVILHLDLEEAIERFEDLGIKDAESMLDPYLQRGPFLGLEDGSLTTDQFQAALSHMSGRLVTYPQVYDAFMGIIDKVPQKKLNYIQKKRETYRVVILSNTNPYIRAFTQSNSFSRNELALDDYVDKVYASFEMEMLKPNEDIFLQLIEEEGLDPNEALFIDDGEQNCATAKRLGFHTLCPEDGEDWRSDVDNILEELNF